VLKRRGESDEDLAQQEFEPADEAAEVVAGGDEARLCCTGKWTKFDAYAIQ
jgi:hypothetical protein